MKKILRFAALVLVPALFGCNNGNNPSEETLLYKAGAYTGEAKGYHRGAGIPVTVQVTCTAEAISGVELTNHRESSTREAVQNALTKIPQAIVARQSPEVDGVSGATDTSRAIINAAKDCVSQAALSAFP